MFTEGNERGAVSVMFAIVAVGLFMAMLLVVDGGRRLNAVRDARHLADNAARFGAQQVDVGSLRDGPTTPINRQAAKEAVEGYLTDYAERGGSIDGFQSIRVVDPTPGDPEGTLRIEVEVVMEVDQIFFDSRPVTARASADPVSGVVDS